ncbi:RHS repeat-associated protein [Treponema pedis]
MTTYNNFLTQQARKGLNEKNLLTKSSDKNYTVHYRYGEDGQRALKYTEEGRSETLYFNNFFTIHIPIYDKDNPQGLRVHKHIFVGNSRLVTAMTHTDNHGDNDEQKEKRYYYHSDHLGSAQFVTDWRGKQYEYIEYTPYGELWTYKSKTAKLFLTTYNNFLAKQPVGLIEETAPGIDKLPFRFTGKELDEETGLYYYGARYLDPKYSRWLSGDPSLSDYIPQAPVNDEAKKHNENLPGMGGVFNVVNLHVYHYAGNNPVKYIDPDGKENEAVNWWKEILDVFSLDVKVGLSFDLAFISKVGIDLFSKGAKFSTEGYQEVITAGINSGIIGLNITAPDYTPEISGLTLFAEQCKVSLNIGPVIYR